MKVTKTSNEAVNCMHTRLKYSIFANRVYAVQHVAQSSDVALLIFVKLAIAGAQMQTQFFSVLNCFDIVQHRPAVAQWRDVAVVGVHFFAVLFN